MTWLGRIFGESVTLREEREAAASADTTHLTHLHITSLARLVTVAFSQQRLVFTTARFYKSGVCVVENG
jgi:hypothetical protein